MPVATMWFIGNFSIAVTSTLVVLASAYSYNDTITCENPSLTDTVTKAQVLQYGQCLPYQKEGETRAALCDEFYTPHMDKFFLPHGRFLNNTARLIQFTADVVNIIDILQIEEPCKDAAKRGLCYYYLPPCGNVTHFVPPNSLCMPVCEHVLSGLCQREWSDALELFYQYTDFLAKWQVDILNCSRSSTPMQGFPHCCSDAGIKTYANITAALSVTTHVIRSSQEGVPVTLVSSVAVVFIILLTGLVMVITIVVVAVKWFGHSKVVLHVYGDHLDIHESPSSATLHTVTDCDHNGSHHRHILATMDQESQRQASLKSVTNTEKTKRVASCYIREMSEANLLIPQGQLKLLDSIGQGEFGVVYKGHLNGDWEGAKQTNLVAVKTLKAGSFSTSDISNLIEESLKMKSFDHPNVLHLIGVCIDAGAAPYLVMPYMLNGSLLSYLRKERPKLTIVEGATEDLADEAKKKLLLMCLQIAKGMGYLAEQKFVHRDLAARNCMINEDFTIKVADFGLSEDIYCKNYFRQALSTHSNEKGIIKLPIKWMALESLTDGIFTEKTDVWSFGVTCWEVFSLGRSPYPGVDPFTLIKYLEEGKRLDKPNNAACTGNVYDVMSTCWREQPEKRPSFAELVLTLTSLLEEIAAYMDFSVLTCLEQAVKYDHLYAKAPPESQKGYDHLEPIQ